MKIIPFYYYSAGALFFLLTFALSYQSAHSNEIVIDSVVASVNGEPITLQDIEARLAINLQPSDLRSNGDARFVLDQLILEHLIRAEARQREVHVAPGEVDRYIQQVMTQNNLSEQEFEAALLNEGSSPEEYRAQIEMDILQTKLSTEIFRGGVSVSENEIQAFLAENPQLQRTASRVTLRQIFVSQEGRAEQEAKELIEDLLKKLSSGSSFEKLAIEYSESYEAQDGGLLGTVPEGDLSSEIFDAVFALSPGEVSRVVRTALGYHLFLLEDRISEGGNLKAENLHAEVRTILQNKKLQSRMQSYFSNELYEKHIIEKKV